MCVELLLGDLNSDFYLPYPTSIYICGVTIASKMCSSNNFKILNWEPFLFFFLLSLTIFTIIIGGIGVGLNMRIPE